MSAPPTSSALSKTQKPSIHYLSKQQLQLDRASNRSIRCANRTLRFNISLLQDGESHRSLTSRANSNYSLIEQAIDPSAKPTVYLLLVLEKSSIHDLKKQQLQHRVSNPTIG
eukprot:g65444.t1